MSEVLTKIERGAGWITLSGPSSRNALSPQAVIGLAEAFRRFGEDASVRCIVLRGDAGHFCSGADLRKTFSEDPEIMNKLEEHIDRFHALIHSVVENPKPTIAAMDGAAVGFGADLALSCDLRIAGTNAYIQERFVKIGLMPDGGGTFWLPRILGTARAFSATYLAEKFEGDALVTLGLVNRKVASEDLDKVTTEIVDELVASPPLALAAIKRAIYASLGDVRAALKRERDGQLKLLRSQDCMEGVMAWAQKRTPQFTGQ
ncbi:MAG: enoyl-CoA hydratase/isomerase family protein [Polyangiaceae bacterium]|nr:enoyl-CoA hydratase/isomerase family protein [Polyangiaceae bacterium]